MLAGKANTGVFVLPAMTGVEWSGGVVAVVIVPVPGHRGGVSVVFFPNISPLLSSLNPILAIQADGCNKQSQPGFSLFCSEADLRL